jgi:hypothetical protein
MCVGNATELHCTDRAILNHWTKYYVFFEYESMYKVQETMNPKCRADSFYVSEIKYSYLIFSVFVPYFADGSNPGYPPSTIPKLKWLHTKGNMSALSYAQISNFLMQLNLHSVPNLPH